MRPSEVFVRSLSHQEAVRLKRLSTRAEHQSTRIRAAILLASNVKTPVPQIARMWLTDESHVRKVIHEFNEEGFDSLPPRHPRGAVDALETRAARVPELYGAASVDGPVISFDQMGPISLKPIPGAGWARRKRRERLRATYNRQHGIRYIFGALDVHRDRLYARMRPRRAGSDVLGCMPTIRLVYPARQEIYWIQDNLSANWTPDIRACADANRIELVATPTYAGYLNRIESHFRPI